MKRTQKKLDKLDKTAASSQWLDRVGLWELVCGMMVLSEEYDFPWAASWERHLDNPEWLGRAMGMTFEHISRKIKTAYVHCMPIGYGSKNTSICRRWLSRNITPCVISWTKTASVSAALMAL